MKLFKKLNEIKEEEKDQVIKDFLKSDNLIQLKQKYGFMADLNEIPITFLPTYKLKMEENQYTTEKEKTPSWCDRILWHQNKGWF